MMNFILLFEKYMIELRLEEKALHTIEKYQRDILKFREFLGSRGLEKQVVVEYKNSLIGEYEVSSVNSMLTALNRFLEFCGRSDCKVKLLKVQHEIFLRPEKELSRAEYERLVLSAGSNGDEQLSLLIQTICSCGIRVSELQFLTKSALHSRQMRISCKNKNRTVLLPTELCKKLIIYCKAKKIENGVIFRTKSGNPLDRSNIWKKMKTLCKKAKVAKTKVFPHNLRHLFARTHYKLEKDISRLADILGHSNINTTRIYTMETGKIHQRQIDKMALLL